MLGYFLLEPGISRKGSSSGSTGLKGRVRQSQVRHPGHGYDWRLYILKGRTGVWEWCLTRLFLVLLYPVKYISERMRKADRGK